MDVVRSIDRNYDKKSKLYMLKVYKKKACETGGVEWRPFRAFSLKNDELTFRN